MKSVLSRVPAAILAMLALAGCDGVRGTPAGSMMSLSSLSEADLANAQLPGELACSFSTPDGDLLLLARGNVASPEPAEGLIKVAGAPDRLTSPGGFDAMLDGGTFTASSSTVRIDLTGPAAGGGESPPNPATLTFEAPGAEAQILGGRWTCGP